MNPHGCTEKEIRILIVCPNCSYHNGWGKTAADIVRLVAINNLPRCENCVAEIDTSKLGIPSPLSRFP
jgi:hypothetical protein